MRIFSKRQTGLNLIEVIIFILILSIALGAIISVYIYTTRHSANTMLTLKTVELSQALMDEILSKAYDENTPIGGGCVDGFASTSCTSGDGAKALLITDFGIDNAETRDRFDDVDDYHDIAYCGAGVNDADLDPSCVATTCTNLEDETGADISADYSGYSICINVSFAGDEMNSVVTPSGLPSTVNVNTNDAKRIDLIVQDPLSARLIYSAYRANY